MPLDLGDGSDPSAARIARVKDALEVLGLEIGDVQDVPVEMPPCGVAVLITATAT